MQRFCIDACYFGIPAGLVNRKKIDGNLVLKRDSWRSAVAANWNIHHLDLVAFISNNSTNEILQAESEPAENTN